MEKTDLLIVESECEIIKPIAIKNKYNKQLSIQSKNLKNEKDKTNCPIFEILNILNTPINPNFKERNIPNDINNSNFINNEFENELEDNIKFVKDVNKYDFSSISKITKSLIEIEKIKINN